MKNRLTFISLFSVLMLSACALPPEFQSSEVDKTYEDGAIKDVVVSEEDADAVDVLDETEALKQDSANSDITLPPSIASSNAGQAAEQNPDETVSFRRWRDEQAKTADEK